MKPPLIIGVILLIAGILILTLGGFSLTREKRVLDAGPLKVNTRQTDHFPIPSPVGYLCVAGGIVAIVLGTRKS